MAINNSSLIVIDGFGFFIKKSYKKPARKMKIPNIYKNTVLLANFFIRNSLNLLIS
jgi:hypothetical protein